METVLIAGGTGLVGARLTALLRESGYEVVILTRDPGRFAAAPGLRYAYWNPAKGEIDPEAVRAAQHIINLAGAGVAEKRWTAARKREIVDSRVQSGQTLVRALKETGQLPQSFLQASAIGWYGADPAIPNPRPFTEELPADGQYLGATCLQWEQSVEGLPEAVRLCRFRIGIVLSKAGGAVREFVKPMQFGVAAVLGSGCQVISWIHVDDLCRMFIYAMQHPELRGTYNAVGPHPADNRAVTLALARARNGKAFLAMPVPAFLLKLMLGEMSIEVLKSATVSAAKIQAAGFVFQYGKLEDAAAEVVRKK